MSPKMDSSTHVRCPRTSPAIWGVFGGIADESVGKGAVREANASVVPGGERAQGKEPVVGPGERDARPQAQTGEAADARQGAANRAAVPASGAGLSREADPNPGRGVEGDAVSVVGEVEGGAAVVDAVDQAALGVERARGKAAVG